MPAARVAELAHRIAWSSGPTYRVIDTPPEDISQPLENGPATRIANDGGTVTLVFHLHDVDPEEPTIGRYAISASSAERCRVDVFDLWPPVPED